MRLDPGGIKSRKAGLATNSLSPIVHAQLLELQGQAHTAPTLEGNSMNSLFAGTQCVPVIGSGPTMGLRMTALSDFCDSCSSSRNVCKGVKELQF